MSPGSGALAALERELIPERTKDGLEAARARGRNGGRPKRLSEKQLALLRKLYKDKQNPIKDILQTLSLSKSTLYRAIKSSSSI